MSMQKWKSLACLLTLMLAVSVASIPTNVPQNCGLSQPAEAQVVGGDNNCAKAWGVGLALAAATLSPCGVVCATLAWYDLLAIGAYCG